MSTEFDTQKAVTYFHRMFGQPIRTLPKFPADSEIQFRLEFLQEEIEELAEAIRNRDIVGVADALADINYVNHGTALYFGIDLNAVLQEVHDSNIAKLGDDGLPIVRDDGKVLKPEGWQPPDIELILDRQRELHKSRKRDEARQRVYAGGIEYASDDPALD